jgi:hypothetical protein
LIVIGWEDLLIAGKLRGKNDQNNAILSQLATNNKPKYLYIFLKKSRFKELFWCN